MTGGSVIGTPDAGAGPEERRRFSHIAVAGIAFQGGSAAVDSGTIMAALVHQLTGSALAVGAVTAILRIGWLSPQLLVGYLAQRRGSSLRYYAIGGFGRAACLAVLALVLYAGSNLLTADLAVAVLIAWTAYAFVSGIVAVPYNDIVARSVASERRSRLLALRFFGGGVVALAVAALAGRLTAALPFPASFATIVAVASGLMFVSSTAFVAAGEPEKPHQAQMQTAFGRYLRDGIDVLRNDPSFRLFVVAQWFGGAVLMALPFYVVRATTAGVALADVALLLGAQTAGALSSNAVWGWWGDRLGKGSLLQAVTLGRTIPPILVLLSPFLEASGAGMSQSPFVVAFFVLGALSNGLTIAVIGFLMEVSPEDERPAYSGYFNAMTAPASLFPLLGGAIAAVAGLAVVFAVSLVAAILQFFCVRRLRAISRRSRPAIELR